MEADPGLARHVDHLYRSSAQGSLRRIAAEPYPQNWRERISHIDDILATEYDQAAKAELQTFENETDLAARRLLTSLQAQLQDLSDRKTALEARRSRWSSALDSIGTILTVFVFIVEKS